jgi:hypothetical protein
LWAIVRLCKQGVAGSNPVTSTNFFLIARELEKSPWPNRPLFAHTVHELCSNASAGFSGTSADAVGELATRIRTGTACENSTTKLISRSDSTLKDNNKALARCPDLSGERFADQCVKLSCRSQNLCCSIRCEFAPRAA